MTDHQPILVMGASSGIGRGVLRLLAGGGLPLRASARRPLGTSIDGVETVAADLTRPETLARAFDGMAQVFLFAVPASAPAILSAAREAGVARIVLLSSGSVLVPSCADNPITIEHREVEQALTSAGGPTLIPIRPLVLATNTLMWAHQIRSDGAVRLYQPDALSAPVHEADVAAVAAAALTDPACDSPVSGLLTGPTQSSQRDQVAAIGRALDREIDIVEESREEALARLTQFVPLGEAEAILLFFDDCAAGNSPATSTAREVLGREPFAYPTWASDHAGDFR